MPRLDSRSTQAILQNLKNSGDFASKTPVTRHHRATSPLVHDPKVLWKRKARCHGSCIPILAPWCSHFEGFPGFSLEFAVAAYVSKVLCQNALLNIHQSLNFDPNLRLLVSQLAPESKLNPFAVQ